MAEEQNNNSFNDQPVLVEDNSLSKIARNLIIVALVVVAVVVAGVMYTSKKQQAEESASDMLAKAKGPEELQKVLNQYPDTSAGASALLMIAASHQEKQEYQVAADLYNNYAQKYAKSPLASSARFAHAQCLEAAGKKADARDAYLSIVNAKPASSFAGAAAVSLAKIYLAENNMNAARQTLTDFLSRDIGSSFQPEAARLLRELPAEPQK